MRDSTREVVEMSNRNSDRECFGETGNLGETYIGETMVNLFFLDPKSAGRF